MQSTLRSLLVHCRYGYGKPLSPALIGGDGASGFVGMCVCVWTRVCEHPLPLLASPRGGRGGVG